MEKLKANVKKIVQFLDSLNNANDVDKVLRLVNPKQIRDYYNATDDMNEIEAYETLLYNTGYNNFAKDVLSSPGVKQLSKKQMDRFVSALEIFLDEIKLKSKRLNTKAKSPPKDPEDNPILMSLFEQVVRGYGDLQIEDYKYIIEQIKKYPKYLKLFSGKSVYKVVPASEFPKAKKGSKLIFRRKSGFTNLCTRWFANIYGAQNAIEYGLGSEYDDLESFPEGEPLLILVAKTDENSSKQWLNLSNVAKYIFEAEEGENIFYPGPVVCSVLKITQADRGW